MFGIDRPEQIAHVYLSQYLEFVFYSNVIDILQVSLDSWKYMLVESWAGHT